MAGEFFWSVRLLYGTVFAWGIVLLLPFGSVKHVLANLVVIIIVSFLMQYGAFHYMIRKARTIQSRAALIFIVLVIAIGVDIWAVYHLATFSYRGEYEDVLRDFMFLISTYNVAAGSFVGMACAHRAFRLYGTL